MNIMQPLQVYPDLKKMCRLCLTEEVVMVDIFPSLAPSEHSTAIHKISVPLYIMTCAGLEVQTNDNLPNKICRDCRYQLEKSYNFRKLSQASDSKLKKHIRLLNSGKVSRIFSRKAIKCEQDNQNKGVNNSNEGMSSSNCNNHHNGGDDDDDDDDDDDVGNHSTELTFVQIMDKEKALAQERERNELCERMKDDFEQRLKEEQSNFQKETEQLKGQLERMLRKQIYEELRDSIELEVKEQCMKEARHQLREEVMEDCRAAEMKSLLLEMEIFLKEKRLPQQSSSTVKADHQQRSLPMHHSVNNKADQLHITEVKEIHNQQCVRSVEYELKESEQLTMGSNHHHHHLVETTKDQRDLERLDETVVEENGLKEHHQHHQLHLHPENESEIINRTQKEEQCTVNGIDYLIYDAEMENEECDQDRNISPNALKILQELESSESHELVHLLESEVDDEELPVDSNDGSQDTTTSYHIDDYGSGNIKVYKNCRVEFEQEEESVVDGEEEEGEDDNIMIINLQGLENMDTEEIEQHEEEVEEGELMTDGGNIKESITIEEINETDDQNNKATEQTIIKKKILMENAESSALDGLHEIKDGGTEENSGGNMNDVKQQSMTTNAPQRVTDTLKTFKCGHCPIVFSTHASLERHLKVHKKGGNNQCPECHIVLSCNSALRRHMFVHAKNKPFACNECGKRFVQREILTRHMLTHSGIRPHACPHCERSFAQRVNLRNHIDRYHSEVPKIDQFPCHLCPKRFKHASGLSRHLASHGGIAFQCSECDRTFGDRSSIKRHILNVHGNGRFKKSKTCN